MSEKVRKRWITDWWPRRLNLKILRQNSPESNPYGPDWGPEEEMLTAKGRFEGKKLREPYSATEMGLIYINPAGPGGVPDPKRSAQEIRFVFAKMGMDDEDTV